jgi:tripartite-type tricarboxylate transporter receptor subunit TctC
MPAIAQQYPSQDIHVVCGFPAGSGADVIVRYYANKIGPMAGKSIIVENRTGAAGFLAVEHVARAKPDGYTVLMTGGNSIAAMMSLMKTPPVDVRKTLQLVATINRQAFVFMVDSKKPWKNIEEMTKAMLEKGDKASYASTTPEATVMGEIYKAKTGVKAQEVAYRTAVDTVNDMISGALDFGVQNPVFALAQAREGKMRILGIGSTDRIKAMGDIPTMTEQGIPMDVVGWWAAAVPAGTPQPMQEQLNKWFGAVNAMPETIKFLTDAGGDPMSLSPDAAQAMMVKDVDRWKEFVQIAKITPQG